jgi:hypothetical protein
MDPAIAALDLAKAGAIIASMVESYLSAGAPPLDAKGAPHDDVVQDQRSAYISHEHRATLLTGPPLLSLFESLVNPLSSR